MKVRSSTYWLLLAISSCIHFTVIAVKEYLCIVEKKIITRYIELYSHVDIDNMIFEYSNYYSLYRAVFTTVYIILPISDYHLFSHKSIYFY